ncbi:MAG: thioredoxin [Victivallaceae bacterium]|nr:thioredoxin [Victivallaceae bacterium]NLK82475.1 thioredoxin [Lentisphaerota bacterium]MDD3117075.1 thioredoxin [Victivallaceae bacterium]MDD3703373.1 thioredoxin [Victivallaceae bacterium]MDD4318021.1 thioredoxin [Victivallaceae bacterium]
MSAVKHLTNSDFDAETSKGVVLVDFWAPWCGPCKMLGPILEQVAAEVGDTAIVAKVDIEENQDLAVRFKISNIPAIFILKDGAIVNQMVGMKDKTTLVNAIKNA